MWLELSRRPGGGEWLFRGGGSLWEGLPVRYPPGDLVASVPSQACCANHRGLRACVLCLSAWLVLQAHRWVVQAGDPIVLRCHTWKDFPIYKVQFFQNGRGKKFFYQNSNFHIPRATAEHNGSYFCRGMIQGRRNESSEAVQVLVLGERGAGLEGPGPGEGRFSEPQFL